MGILEKISSKKAKIGVIGLGYVGLPLSLEFTLKGYEVLGFDIDEKKPASIMQRKTYIRHVSEVKLQKAVDSGKLNVTTDFSRLPETDAIIICVPTPLNKHREPDMSYISSTAAVVQKYLRRGQLVSLESTTYPGTTEEILLPMFEEAPIVQKSDIKSNPRKFIAGEDFYLAFSPEREDPNNPDYSTATIPKVVGGVTSKCIEAACALYNNVVVKTVPVSSVRTAEATKLLENIYRSVNIALINELKMVFDKMDIDIWEVIEAARTKPFGFKAFYPGPGLGGHCIPIDPFYLTWKAREYDISTKFIELAGEINSYQPYYVAGKTAEALNKMKKVVNESRILILGAAYKKDIDDMRESPSLKLIEILREKGALVDYNDPYIEKLPQTRKYKYNMNSVEILKGTLQEYDAVILSTDHNSYDYRMIAENSALIIDCRNAFGKNGIISANIVKA